MGVVAASNEAAGFWLEHEECLAQAAKAATSSAKEQWLVFADEWLKQAQATEAQQRREAARDAVASAK